MKKVNLKVTYYEYPSLEDLNKEDQRLIQAAEKAKNKAYAPYSTFQVGAAALLDNGEIITGNNQENVAYPSGLCAERVVLFYAQAQYPDIAVKTLAITAMANDFEIKDPVTPCGSCRQVMAETEQRSKTPIRIIMKGDQNKILVMEGINNMLPLMFFVEELKK